MPLLTRRPLVIVFLIAILTMLSGVSLEREIAQEETATSTIWTSEYGPHQNLDGYLPAPRNGSRTLQSTTELYDNGTLSQEELYEELLGRYQDFLDAGPTTTRCYVDGYMIIDADEAETASPSHWSTSTLTVFPMDTSIPDRLRDSEVMWEFQDFVDENANGVLLEPPRRVCR